MSKKDVLRTVKYYRKKFSCLICFKFNNESITLSTKLKENYDYCSHFQESEKSI